MPRSMEFTTENVVQAVSALHTDPSPERKAAANEWLTRFQRSAHAWTVVDQLLHAEGMPMEVTFLAVQTLRSKMQRDLAEVPEEQHFALRDSIIAHVHTFGCGATHTYFVRLPAELPVVHLVPPVKSPYQQERAGCAATAGRVQYIQYASD